MTILLLILIYLAFISLGLPDSLLGAVWPAAYPEFGVPYSFAGIYSVAIFLSTVLSSMFSAHVIRRFGTGKVTAVSVGLTATALMGIYFAPSALWLLAMCLPLGLGAGAVDAGLNAYVAEHYKSRHMSWLHCFWGVGAMAGPILLSRYIEAGNWRGGYRLISFLQFGLCAALLIAIPLWGKVARLNEGKELRGEGKERTVGLIAALQIKGVKPALLSFLFYCGVETTVGLWGASYLSSVKGFSPAQSAGLISVFFFGITIGRFLNGFATIKLSNRVLVRTGILTTAVGIVVLLLPLPESIAVVGLGLIGFGCAPVFPCLLHETPVLFGRENAQAIMGFQLASAYVGCSLMPPLFGLVAQITSLALFPVCVLLFAGGLFACTERVGALSRQTAKPAAE